MIFIMGFVNTRRRFWNSSLWNFFCLLIVSSWLCIFQGYAQPQGNGGENKIDASHFGPEVAISAITVLLPHTSGAESGSGLVQPYRLRALNGCFAWQVSNPDVARLEALYEDESRPECSDAVLIYPLTVLSINEDKRPPRMSTFVIAEDLLSGRVLRCEVFVDSIDRIEILTTTRSMYKDEDEVLQVQAYDEEGNLFSNIDELLFRWSLLPSDWSDGNDVLKFVPFRDANVEVSQSLLDMEKRGTEGGQVLIRGLHTGKAIVGVRLVERGYEQVKMATVLMSVLEVLELRPAHSIYIACGSSLTYTLGTYTSHGFDPIPMPSEQYEWQTSNAQVACVDPRGLLLALDLGACSVRAQYINMTDNQAAANVNVVTPTYVALRIVPAPALPRSSSSLPFAQKKEEPEHHYDIVMLHFSERQLNAMEKASLSLHDDGDDSEQEAATTLDRLTGLALNEAAEAVYAACPSGGGFGRAIGAARGGTGSGGTGNSAITDHYLVRGRAYVAYAEVFDADSHRLYVLDTMEFEASDSLLGNTEDHVVRSLHHVESGARRILKAEKVGVVELQLGLQNLVREGTEGDRVDQERQALSCHRKLENKLMARQKVYVHDPVRVRPRALVLPGCLPAAAAYGEEAGNLMDCVWHTFALRALGGSGRYTWHSASSAIASVNRNGLVTARGLGETAIRVADHYQAANNRTAPVYVVPPATLKMRPIRVEVRVGSPLHLPVAVFGPAGRAVHNCSALPFVWELSDPMVFALQNQSLSNAAGSPDASHLPLGACAQRTFLALHAGACTVKVSLYHSLTAEITIFAYEPLRVVSPQQDALLALGTSWNLEFAGGPRPWHLEPSAYYDGVAAGEREVAPERAALQLLSKSYAEEEEEEEARVDGEYLVGSALRVRRLHTHQGGNLALHRYRVRCVAHGETFFWAQVGNRKSAGNKFPAVESVLIRVRCEQPHALWLLASNPRDALPSISLNKMYSSLTLPRCPHALPLLEVFGIKSQREVASLMGEEEEEEEIHEARHPFFTLCENTVREAALVTEREDVVSFIRTRHQFVVNVTGLDQYGVRFLNVSSLAVTYQSHNHTLATLIPTDKDGKEVKPEPQASLIGFEHEGPVVIGAQVSAYHEDMLKEAMVAEEMIAAASTLIESMPLRRALHLRFRNNAQLFPRRLSLLAHRQARGHLYLAGGSGHYHFSSNATASSGIASWARENSQGLAGNSGEGRHQHHSMASASTSAPANFTFREEQRVLEIIPRAPSTLRVRADDLCLAGGSGSDALVHLSDVHAVRVRVDDLLPLHEELILEVMLYDDWGKLMDASQTRYLNVSVHADSEHVHVMPLVETGESSRDVDSILKKKGTTAGFARNGGGVEHRHRFTIRGVAVGSSRLTASVRQVLNGNEVSSVSQTIHVFAPFRVIPPRIVLLPEGARFQVQHRGGPPVRATVRFASTNESVIRVLDEQSGLVESVSEGQAQVMASVWVRDPPDLLEEEKHKGAAGVKKERLSASARMSSQESGNWEDHMRRMGSDTAVVEVRHMREGIRIHSPSTQVTVGNEVVLRVVGGRDDEWPFMYCTSGLRFAWSVSNPEVAVVMPIYGQSHNNVTLDEESGFSVRFVAQSAGDTDVRVRILAAPTHLAYLRGQSTNVRLSVHNPLRLLTPSTLLLSPYASFQIRTNKDGAEALRYQLLSTPLAEDAAARAEQDRAVLSQMHQYYAGGSREGKNGNSGAASQEGSSPYLYPSASIVRLADESSGRLFTQARPGLAHVLVTDESSHSVVVQVVVKPPHSVQLRPHRPTSHTLPVGARLRVDVVVRDDRGAVFDQCANLQLEYLQNLLHCAGVGPGGEHVNRTVTLTGLRPGRSVLRVRGLGYHMLEDYLQITVGDMLMPSRPLLHVGGLLQLRTAFAEEDVAEEEAEGVRRIYAKKWRSDTPSVLQVDSASGLATALEEGHATVYHNSTLFTYTRVLVARVADIFFDRDAMPSLPLTNLPSISGMGQEGQEAKDAQPPTYRVPVQFQARVPAGSAQAIAAASAAAMSGSYAGFSNAAHHTLRPLSLAAMESTERKEGDEEEEVEVADNFVLVPLHDSLPNEISGGLPAIRQRIQLRCAVLESRWAVAKAVVDEDGFPYCEIQPLAAVKGSDSSEGGEASGMMSNRKTGELPSAYEIAPATLTLEAVASDRGQTYRCVRSLSFPFVAAFRVLAPDHLYLDAEHLSTLVTVVSRGQLSAASSNVALLEVGERYDLSSDGVHVFELAVVDDERAFRSLTVSFLDGRTAQHHRLLVSYSPLENFSASDAALSSSHDASSANGNTEESVADRNGLHDEAPDLQQQHPVSTTRNPTPVKRQGGRKESLFSLQTLTLGLSAVATAIAIVAAVTFMRGKKQDSSRVSPASGKAPVEFIAPSEQVETEEEQASDRTQVSTPMPRTPYRSAVPAFAASGRKTPGTGNYLHPHQDDEDHIPNVGFQHYARSPFQATPALRRRQQAMTPGGNHTQSFYDAESLSPKQSRFIHPGSPVYTPVHQPDYSPL